MGLGNFINISSRRNYIIFAKANFSVRQIDLIGTDVALFRYDLHGQLAEQVKVFNNEIEFWMYAQYLILWFANIYYLGCYSNEFRKCIVQFFDNLFLENLNLILQKNTALLSSEI